MQKRCSTFHRLENPTLELDGPGGVLIAFGLSMLVWTVVLFDRVGEGTLAIGSPVKLVVRGPYRHVRNPMMTGVFCIQLGTAIATASGPARSAARRTGSR